MVSSRRYCLRNKFRSHHSGIWKPDHGRSFGNVEAVQTLAISPIPLTSLRDRLTAGRGTLNPLIMVRIHVPEPIKPLTSVMGFYCSPVAAKQGWTTWLGHVAGMDRDEVERALLARTSRHTCSDNSLVWDREARAIIPASDKRLEYSHLYYHTIP